MPGAMALDASTDWTSEEIRVPSKQRFTGHGRISFNVEKNFLPLLIPATSQPLTKRGVGDMDLILSIPFNISDGLAFGTHVVAKLLF
jgi:hypothetical protein